ncbi:unnamed protein product [Adineta ricciae]|uniref:Uncharacterized protein n=1 Tax=Adineta ricciae TaxID=249248 RepID=A0A814WLQ3_ADIRI|nr:unnamed protein product [Adineta ricciae]
MSSISPACQALKDEYDACFNSWFAEHYLKGDTSADMCTNLFKKYQACIKEAIKEHKITLWELENELSIEVSLFYMSTDNRIRDNMHRQSSRTAYNLDVIDCIANESDSEFDDDKLHRPMDQKRPSSNSRRNPTSKYSNGTSSDRSARPSSPPVTHKRPSSPSLSVLTASHSQHKYPVSSRHQHVNRSPSPDRYNRPRRHPPPAKRQHSRSRSRSRSSHERRKSTSNRPYNAASKKRSNDNDELTSTPSMKKSTSSFSSANNKPDVNDLSTISDEDIPHKLPGPPIDISSINAGPIATNQPTPSVSVSPAIFNNSLELSNNVPECELSLFAKSSLSMANTSSVQTTANIPNYDLLQTIDLMTKFKTMQSIPSSNHQIEACSKAIFELIQKQIQLQKKAFECREREINIYERELLQREKCLNDKASPVDVLVQATVAAPEPQQHELTMTREPNINIILPPESVPQPIPSANNQPTTVSSGKPSSVRRSRFTNAKPMITSKNLPSADLYANVGDESAVSQTNSTNNAKNTVLSPILAPNESTKITIIPDSKVASNSCRKVEIQTDNNHPVVTSSESPQDLRFTLRNNRTKQTSVDESKELTNELINISQEPSTTFTPRLVKTISNTDSKQESHDDQHQQQRSVTSTDQDIGETIQKRDNHQRRTSTDRQQHNPREHASSSRSSKERSYSQRSTKYESNQKHRPDGDLRSRIAEHKYKNPSRTLTIIIFL